MNPLRLRKKTEMAKRHKFDKVFEDEQIFKTAETETTEEENNGAETEQKADSEQLVATWKGRLKKEQLRNAELLSQIEQLKQGGASFEKETAKPEEKTSMNSEFLTSEEEDEVELRVG